MSDLKLATYQSPRGARAGVIIGDTVFDVAEIAGRPVYATMLDVLPDWDAVLGVIRDAARPQGASAAASRSAAPSCCRRSPRPAESSAPAPTSATT
jgi:hypothetical protein